MKKITCLLLCLLLAGLTGCVRAEAAVQAERKQKAAVITTAETEHAEKEKPAAAGCGVQKPTKPIPKITGPKSSLKKKVKPVEPMPTESETPPTETEPTPTQPQPTEPTPTEPEPTEPTPVETEPAEPEKAYSIQAAMDYGNAYAQSLGFNINYELIPATAGYWPPDEQSDRAIVKYGGQAYLNDRVKQGVDATYEWMQYQHEQYPNNPNYMVSKIPICVYIEYRYTDADRGDVYWIYVLS